ncbi:PAS domain S-box-containing protein/diguanylate cyclase (GGDEF)-like protein [Mobilisporobacter senegalensis]|uniref:PAS domain S-box-containing protein/diguanylate cyclase (GGDEF)-like protein n=1 Tax=Mobilisporobacter senegalensis TaxID=1329262 RepID=A0A3N1XB26_9FIRM|nr:diguanylate cyclase [Mobilisporobacter senegalensis]ROR23969.1 PAS domain S-box-containing protein/diguanylate cyclase (GGDEF)-like protein [Mobilisporobacter senegalensis]
MEWIREGLKLLAIKYNDQNKLDFEKYNSLLVLGRIRIISMATIVMAFYFMYFDYMAVRNGADKVYTKTLITAHMISVAASILFLLFYKRIIREDNKKNYKVITTIPKIYVFLYVLVGVISSVNSQRFTGNINSYIILSLIAAIGFTLKPWFMLCTLAANHMIFLRGIGILCKDINMLSTKQINSTAMIGVALILSISFYKFRMNDFIYKRKLKESEENFKKLFYVNPFPVFITRFEDGKLIKASERAYSLMGIREEETDDLSSIDLYMRDENRDSLTEKLKKNDSTYNHIVEYDINGKSIWATANHELIDYHGEKCILTGIMDITEIRKAEEELSQFASTDVLTGIMNRRIGLEKIQELINESKYRDMEFVLCFLDINDLKYVNDTYGHREGDSYIKTFCSLVKEEIHEDDVFFRMGGDEFIIVFMDKTISEAEIIWKRLMASFHRINKQEYMPYMITASHGLFYYRSGMEFDLEQIIDIADKQMYKEKLWYKNNSR